MLQFDKQGLANVILTKLEIQLEYACIAWKTEVLNKLKHPFFGTDARPEVDHEIKKESNKIIAYLKANTYVLADSYGTGSLMLSDNPGFKAYMLSGNINPARSGNINPARKGKAIVGRPKGTYVDIFGRKHETSGAFEGINIEGKIVNYGKKRRFTGTLFSKKFKIEPAAPSYAIQMADKWLHETYLPNAYKLAIREVDFAKYLKES